MPGAVAQRAVERLAEDDPGVLDGVVRAGLEVAADRDLEVQAAVAGQQVEHVVQEAHAGGAGARAGAVEAQRERDARLLGLARDLRRSRHGAGFSRTSIDAAWRSKPSARATGAPARASASAAGPMRTSLMRRRKWRALSPEAKRAAPPVGSVWFEPAT